MMSRHFCLSSELSGAIVKMLPNAKNQLSVPGSFQVQKVDFWHVGVFWLWLQ